MLECSSPWLVFLVATAQHPTISAPQLNSTQIELFVY
jgi:hypothetical protein